MSIAVSLEYRFSIKGVCDAYHGRLVIPDAGTLEGEIAHRPYLEEHPELMVIAMSRAVYATEEEFGADLEVLCF